MPRIPLPAAVLRFQGAVIVTLLLLLAPAAALASEAPAFAWHAKQEPSVARAASSAGSEQAMWTTVMRVDTKLGSRALDRYYMWVWTHDSPVQRVYSGPRVTGPWTLRRENRAVPQGFDATTFDDTHWSSGDVVWDPKTKRFLSTPHSIYRARSVQSSFLMTSRDGLTWQLKSPRPVVDAGATGFDSNQATYGRFLRDWDGNVVRDRQGRIVWYYRGTARDAARHETYTLAAATTRTLDGSPWRRAGQIATPNGGGIFALGSALWTRNGAWIVWSIGQPSEMHRKRVGSRPLAVTDGPGSTVYTDSHNILLDGGSIIRTSSGRQLMVFGAARRVAGGPGYRWEVDTLLGS